jgi:ribosomal protein S18 acetylase RimI-like enzyme
MGRSTERQAATVRVASARDLDRLSRIDQAIFTDEPYPFFVLRQLLEVHGDRMLVLDRAGELTGYSLLATRTDRSQCWVLGLGVLEHARGLGYGRLLLDRSIELLTADGVAELWLSVGPDNKIAINLYRSAGFAVVRHHAEYFGHDGDRLILRLPLGG